MQKPFIKGYLTLWMFLHMRWLIRVLSAEENPARLACVKHAASVRPEPGSNSPIKMLTFDS